MSWWQELSPTQVGLVGLGTTLLGVLAGSLLTYQLNLKRLKSENGRERAAKIENMLSEIVIQSDENDLIYQRASSGNKLEDVSLEEMLERVRKMKAIYLRYAHYMSKRSDKKVADFLASIDREKDASLRVAKTLDFPRVVEAVAADDLRVLTRS